MLTSFELTATHNRPLSRRLDRCDRVIQNESRDPFRGNVYYVTMQITFLTRKFRNGERNLHCDVVHITTKWVFRLTLDRNGVFAIKAYRLYSRQGHYWPKTRSGWHWNKIGWSKTFEYSPASF